MSYIDDLNQAAEEALAASASATNSSQIMYDVANGDENTVVSTAGGDVKSLAKAIADITAIIQQGVVELQVEEVTLTEGQTQVNLSTAKTTGMELYVEGVREFAYTVDSETSFTLSDSFPEGTRIWVTSATAGNDISSSPVVDAETGAERTTGEWVAGQTYTYDTIADMVADESLAVGSVVRTLGYYSVMDGGANEYLVVEAGTGTVDGGRYIDLTASSTQAQGMFNDEINVRQFGARANGVEDAPAFEAAAAYARTRQWLTGATPWVRIPRGDYRLYSDTTTEVNWWMEPNSFLSGDLPTIDPTGTADASHLKGTLVRFFGVDQLGTMIVGDPSMSAQKIMQKSTVAGQLCGLATNGGSGIVGVSQTSGRDIEDGSCIGARTVIICDNENVNRAGWANYIEAYKLPGITATCLGQEITLFNDSGNTVRRNPTQQPGSGSDIMYATWYSSGGYYGDDGTGQFKEVNGTCTGAIGVIGKEGGKWDRAITIYEDALGDSNEAIAMPSGTRLSWYARDAAGENAVLAAYTTASRPTGQSGAYRTYVYNNSTGGNTVYDMNPVEFKTMTDNIAALGSASVRWTQVYAASGTINTSDEREKDLISDPAEAELAVGAKLRVRKFKWKSAIEEKGDAARWHFGFIAQEVVEAFASEGLDAFDYGAVCYDEWDGTDEEVDEHGNTIAPAIVAGNRYGVRYDECYALMMAAKFQ